jgi:hypothetical protein
MGTSTSESAGAGGGGGGGKEDAARKANFFTECYNFTSSVERFKRALDRSAAKDAGRREANALETTRLHSAATAETLSAAELAVGLLLFTTSFCSQNAAQMMAAGPCNHSDTREWECQP